MMIIDGHAHACGDYLKVDNIIATLDKNNIDKVILCPGEKDSQRNYNFPNFKTDHVYTVNKVISFMTSLTGVAKYIEDLNQFVFSLCQKNPDRLLQGYWVNPNNNQTMQLLERDMFNYQFKLLKIHQCWSYFKLGSKPFAEIADWAAKNNIPIFIHLKSKQDALDLIRFITTRPDTVFIIGHLIGIAEFIKYRDSLQNVYFDISCPQLVPLQKVQMALDNFGAARLIFGSDIPYGRENVKRNIDRVNSLNITLSDKDNILGNNIQRILYT